MKLISMLRFSIWFLTLLSYSAFGQSTTAIPKEEDEKEDREHIQERIEFFHQQRATKDGGMPFGAIMKAKTEFDALRSLPNQPLPMDAGIWNWEWLGPGNIGGRIRAIAIHPTITNRMWIGATTGGIWRSDNSGASWYPLDDFMANLAVTSIVMDPTNADILYAATGEGFITVIPSPSFQREPAGNGIFKSTDGGITWNQLAATNDTNFAYVSRIAHHPTQTNILYAATQRFSDNTGALYKTTDGGINWTLLRTSTSGGRDVKIHPQKPNRVMFGTTSDIFASYDSGTTWTQLNTGTFSGKLPNMSVRFETFFANGDTVYVSADISQGEVWRSVDSGTTWSRRSTGYNQLGTQGWYNNVLWTDPANSNFVIVGGIDLWRSTDGGTTLTLISTWPQYRPPLTASAHADHHAIVAHPNFDGTTNRTVYFGNDGGIQMTSNIQTVTLTSGWTSLANNLGITQFFGGAAAPNGSVIVGGSQDNDNSRYTPAGGINSWYQAETGDGGFVAIDPSNTNTIYTEYVNLQIERSDNGGDSYTRKINGLTDAGGSALFIAPFIMDPNNSNTLIGGGASIWKTTNKGENWSAISTPFGVRCSALDVATGNPSMVWAGFTNGTVALTTNGGTNWNIVDTASPGLPNRYITDIAVNPFDPYEVFVTIGGYNDSSIWRTTNLGASWELRSGTAPFKVPAVQVNTIRFHPLQPQWLYIGTDLGILATENKGETWSTTPIHTRNEAPANVVVAELFWQGTDKLIAATYGRGMYRCRPLPVVYVDGAYSGTEDGTEFQPYNSVNEGLDAAGNGTIISIKNGDYLNAPLNHLKRGMIRATGGSPVIIH